MFYSETHYSQKEFEEIIGSAYVTYYNENQDFLGFFDGDVQFALWEDEFNEIVESISDLHAVGRIM